MAHRGHLDGRSAQAPGLMRHGSFPAASLSGHQHLEPPATTLEILENKLAIQTAGAEKLIRENQRLASSHVVLRQDIVDTEKEMQMIRSHLGDVQSETDMQIRDYVERIRLMEADMQAGDAVKKELHQVHMEAKRLITERQMLTSEIENVTKELQKLSGNNNNLPDLLAELDGLRKEHQSLRSAFEYEKNTNIKQVEQMRTMEMNLITMTKEADKIRADVANAEKRAQAAQAAAQQVTASRPGTAQAAAVPAATNPYASAYANHPSSAYQQGTTQAGSYHQGTTAGAYAYPTTAYDTATAYQMHANAYAGYSGYPVAGYAQGTLPSYPGTYAAPPQHPVSSGAGNDVASMYGAVSSAGYPAGLVQPTSGAANPGQAQAPAPYPGAYDPTRGAQR